MYANLSELSSRRAGAAAGTLTRAAILAAAAWLQGASELYRATGGVHSAALMREGPDALVSRDDIGRHNAVDKVIGWGLRNGAAIGEGMLVTSGRVSSEILHKAVRGGIPAVVARGAPTHQTVLRARESGIIMVGFARGAHFTVYAHADRVEALPVEGPGPCS